MAGNSALTQGIVVLEHSQRIQSCLTLLEDNKGGQKCEIWAVETNEVFRLRCEVSGNMGK